MMPSDTLNWDIESNRHDKALIANIVFILLIVNYVIGVYFFDIDGHKADWFAFGFGAGVFHFFIQGRETNWFSFLFQSLRKFKISIISKD